MENRPRNALESSPVKLLGQRNNQKVFLRRQFSGWMAGSTISINPDIFLDQSDWMIDRGVFIVAEIDKEGLYVFECICMYLFRCLF